MKGKYKQALSVKEGFTLVELAIVLVIVGLLVGGVIAGQSLIRAAEMRAITTEVNRYLTAMYAFQNKYKDLPGDMKRATTFWGKDNTYCAGHSGPVGTPGTCNGDGDSSIEWAAGANATSESHQFWKQLSLAKLIEGQYTGISTTCGYCGTLEDNYPASRLSGAAWSVVDPSPGNYISSHPQWFDGYYGNSLFLGGVLNYTSNPVLLPAEALEIDIKMDDGKPGLGKVRSWKHSFQPNCTDVDTPETAVFFVAGTNKVCALIFTMK